jgi:hypothetical protein
MNKRINKTTKNGTAKRFSYSNMSNLNYLYISKPHLQHKHIQVEEQLNAVNLHTFRVGTRMSKVSSI